MKYYKKINQLYDIFFGLVIVLYILLLKLFTKKKLFFEYYGYGDSLLYIIALKKILKKNQFCFVFHQIQLELANKFLKKEKILKSPFFLKKNKNFYIVGHILKKFDFLNISEKIDRQKLFENKLSDQIKKKLLKNIKIENNLKIYLKKHEPYICLNWRYIKSSKNENNLTRQTSDKEKIYNIIKFINKYKKKICIVGSNIDFSYQLLKRKYQNDPNIFFVNDKEFDINKNIYIYFKSLGYVGNATGHCEYFYHLKKKCLVFDHFNHGNYSKAEYIFDKNKKNFDIMYKTISFKKKNYLTNFLDSDFIRKIQKKTLL